MMRARSLVVAKDRFSVSFRPLCTGHLIVDTVPFGPIRRKEGHSSQSETDIGIEFLG